MVTMEVTVGFVAVDILADAVIIVTRSLSRVNPACYFVGGRTTSFVSL